MKVREGFVTSEGHNLAYLAVNEHLAGENEPAFVFIHGVLASINFWRDCLPLSIKESRAWYSLSLPAHHPSTVPQDFAPEQVNEEWFFRLMNGALKELIGDKKAIVIGHSTGGFSALNLAINQAPNVIGIVSVGGFHNGNWGSVEGRLVKLAGGGKFDRIMFFASIAMSRKSRFIQRVFARLLAHNRKAYRSSPLSQRMLDNIRPNTKQQDSGALYSLFKGIGPLEIADQLQAINIPCYIFTGNHDPVVPADQSLVLLGEIPDAKAVVFCNVGHMPFMEDTGIFFSALEQALTNIIDYSQRDMNQARLKQVIRKKRYIMNYPEYKEDLQRIHESEVYGKAVFSAAARFTFNSKKKKKWLILKTLEEKVLERYFAYMIESAQPLKKPKGWITKGRIEGAFLGILPWRWSMKLMAKGTESFQEKFLRLVENSEGKHQEFFSYVLAHEKAIQTFANKERSKDTSSLTPVEVLLDK